MTEKNTDTIEFTLFAEETVINDTVKIIASIDAIVTHGLTEAALKENIKDMVKRFIKETKNSAGNPIPVVWEFSEMVRSTHPSGMEQLSLKAKTRVHESDNFALTSRARDVSTDGMNITSVFADTTPTAEMIENAESKLRLSIIEKTQRELAAINNVIGVIGTGRFHLNSINFDNNNSSAPLLSNNRSIAKTASMSSYGSIFSDSENDGNIGNAVKLSMRADIVLRRASSYC